MLILGFGMFKNSNSLWPLPGACQQGTFSQGPQISVYHTLTYLFKAK